MINISENYVEWALLITELDEAKEHLDDLIKEMHPKGSIDEPDFAAHLGHIYAHLNRIWHSRNLTSQMTGEQFREFSKFPVDLETIG